MTSRTIIRRRIAAVGLTAALAVGVASPVAAAGLDFGSVVIGGSGPAQSVPVPLTYALSSLPGNTVVYDGSNSSINLALGSLGLVAPVTANQLLTTIGDVVAVYHVLFTSTSGTDFTVDSTDCLTGVGSCLAAVTFHPTVEGIRTATIVAHLQDVQTSGGGTYASLISLLAPFLATSVESQLNFAVAGVGITEGPVGGVILNVAVEPEPEPCLLIDVTSLDFGTLPFSTEGSISSASRGMTTTSCSTGGETIYAAGTGALGDGEPAGDWALSGDPGVPCDATLDLYGVGLSGVVGAGSPQTVRVATDQRAWIDLSAADVAATTVDYLMPCEGSTGAGQTMTSQVTFTAVIE